MTEQDQSPKHSPLAQSVTRDGKTVRIEIYEDGEGGWLLEVEDEYWNSTTWEDPFASDQEALDEALRTIDEDGIDSLIGLPPERKQRVDIDQSLSEVELDELDDFLANEAIQDTSMDVSTLDGFLTAMAIGPGFVLPSDWLPWVWDMDEGDAEPEFKNEEETSRIMSLIMRHYNALIQIFSTDPASFEPIFWRGNHWGAAEWSEGFMLGFQFNKDLWDLLAIEQPTWFTPFLRLGSDEGIEITKTSGDAEQWMNEIEPSLLRIHAHWRENQGIQATGLVSDDLTLGEKSESVQIVRAGPKIGRNDPCPCGSGKKFKKCCGAQGATPTLH